MIPLAHAGDRSRFGGKAAGLAGLVRAGLPVPHGFALAPDVLAALAGGEASASRWRLLSTIAPAWALRSSAIDEDAAGTSFAGQYASVLGVCSLESLVDAAVTVRESAAHTTAYRSAVGQGSAAPVAAVAQRLVDAVAAGVLFTAHPTKGPGTLLVEAAWGLGETVVQGLVIPDRAELDPDGTVRARQAGHKDVRIDRVGDRVEEREVPADERERWCVSDAVLQALVRSSAACEAVAGGPADVEWAWDGRRLWLLQCRAITTLARDQRSGRVSSRS